jgi:hypothetical protein
MPRGLCDDGMAVSMMVHETVVAAPVVAATAEVAM